jgi:hypothetical protein
MAPQQIVSVDSVFEPSIKTDAAQYTATQLSSLTSLSVTGVYFKGLSTTARDLDRHLPHMSPNVPKL